MNLKLDFEILGWLLVGLGIFECFPTAAALLYGEPALPYAASALVAFAFGVPFAILSRTGDRQLHPRDGFLVVGGSWILASALGALPYILSETLSPVDALFESVAGVTTTGASVMTDVESAPRALLLWRALSQWLGGMGIIVFAIAVLPLLGIGGMQLFKAEVPGPVKDKLSPRVAVTARRLWLIYLGLTAAAGVALVAAGMGPFDALCHAFTTVATGGFSTRNGSVGSFGIPAVEWIITGFMLLGAINFVLHYRLLTGGGRTVWRDEELRCFRLVSGAAVVVIASLLSWGSGFSEETARRAAFQTTSLATSTGYVTADYEAWPPLAQLVLLHLMVLGGMAGSTAGGAKVLRFLIAVRTVRTFVFRSLHRNAVVVVKHAGQPVPDTVLAGIGVFFVAYLVLVAFAAAVVASADYDVVTAVSAGISAVSNIGPALGEVGPTDHYAHFPAYVKLVLSFCMLCGRLEIFTLLVLFHPRFWQR